MAALSPKTLDWIPNARTSLTGRATSTASPDAVFAVLADHERWPDWFPSVRKVEVLGPAEGVGARRRVHIPGAAVEEEFIAWDLGQRWAFTGTAARPGFIRALVEDCQLAPTEAGGTAISYSMHFDPAPALRPLVRLVQSSLTANLDRAMRALAQRAEQAS